MRFRYVVAALVIVGLAFALHTPARRMAGNVKRMECHTFASPGGYAAVGDSITAGSSDPAWGFQARDSWFSQLICEDEDLYSGNFAVPGLTIEQMLERVDEVLDAQPRVVFVLAGTNDLLQGASEQHLARDLEELGDLLDDEARLVVGTLPPISTLDVTVVNEEIFKLAARNGWKVADFHTAVSDGGDWREGFHQDGVHPTEAAAAAMAEVGARAALAAAPPTTPAAAAP